MYGRFKGNTQPHFPVYNSTGRDVVLMINDDKGKHASELLKQLHPLLTGFLLIGVDLRPQWAHKSLKNNSFREIVIKISRTIIYIASWAFVLLIIYGIFTDKSNVPRKQDIANRVLTILIIFLRSVLYWRQKDIVNTLTHLSDAYEKVKLKSKKLNKGFISLLIIVYLGTFISMYGIVLLIFIAKGDTTVQYYTMTTFAARIHEEVQNIKLEVANISSRPSQLTAVEQLLLIARVNNQSNSCLTVWGFMNITKNSVFSSLGALVTFGALFRDL
ncbi:uncharacterized protein TNCV_3457941 [Trichonephila clavipes]|nr:uncharacterized protein TNCV_3457941 [Trichonephila clavipes]